MTPRRIEWVVADVDKRAAEISPTEALVLLVIAYHCDASGKCWPTVPTLAVKTGLGKTAVLEATKRLRARGLIEVESRGQHHPNLYTLNRAALEALPRASQTSAGRTPEMAQTSAPRTAGGPQTSGCRTTGETPDVRLAVPSGPRGGFQTSARRTQMDQGMNQECSQEIPRERGDETPLLNPIENSEATRPTAAAPAAPPSALTLELAGVRATK